MWLTEYLYKICSLKVNAVSRPGLGFTCTLREAEMCPGFPPQAARVTVVSGEKGLWVVWYNSDVVRLGNKGGKYALAGFNAYFRVLGLSMCGGGAEW